MHERDDFSSKTLVKNLFHFQKKSIKALVWQAGMSFGKHSGDTAPQIKGKKKSLISFLPG